MSSTGDILPEGKVRYGNVRAARKSCGLSGRALNTAVTRKACNL